MNGSEYLGIISGGDRMDGVFIEMAAKLLRGNAICRRMVYNPLKNFARRHVGTVEYMLRYAERNREIKEPLQDSFEGDGKVTVGILKDPFFAHEPYAAACRELGVGYRMVDLFAADWLERVKLSGCEFFFTWPTESLVEWKKLTDDRQRVLVEQLGKRLFPDLEACWLYGSKERQSMWLEMNGFPHPKYWIFYRESDALEFVHAHRFDRGGLVGKTDIGAVASGVRILRDVKGATHYVSKAFSCGLQGYFADRRTWQWRHVHFQEFLGDVKEWRIIRLGNSFFGFGKLKKGEFHSGSHEFEHVPPPKRAFDLAWEVTERGNFKSMSVDIFETAEGLLFVNELQCVCGQHSSDLLYKDGVSGRLCRTLTGEWSFEAGTFADLHGCKLRVLAGLEMLKGDMT